MTAPVERLAVHELHGEEVDAGGLLDRIDRHDVRMVERCDGTCLALEALDPLRARGHLGREHLEGYVTMQLRVGGAVHLSHPARADRGGDVIVRDLLTDQERCSSLK